MSNNEESLRIFAGNPKTTADRICLEEPTLRDAIEALYSDNSDDAIILWEGVQHPLSYKYDLPEIIMELITLLSELGTEEGATEVFFRSSDFHTDWQLYWQSDVLKVKELSRLSLQSGFGYQGPLRTTVLSKQKFCSDWKAFLEVAAKDLKRFKLDYVHGYKELAAILEGE